MSNLGKVWCDYLVLCNDRRFGELTEFVHDPVLLNGERKSLAEFASAIKSITEAVPDFHWEVQDLVADDEHVAVRFMDTGTPQGQWLGMEPNGRSFTAQEFAFYRFRESRIEEIWFLLDVQSIKSQLNDADTGSPGVQL